MTEKASRSFINALNALPSGSTTGHYKGRKYVASKTSSVGGKSVKLVAEELGGRDYISLNLYFLSDAAQLYPCEMSREKVISFIEGFEPDQLPA